MANQMPGSYRMGQVVRYKKWQPRGKPDTGEAGDEAHVSFGEPSDPEQPHAGSIIGYIFRDQTFCYLVDCNDRLEMVLPEDILNE
jgi:hypothetical protein